MSPKESIRRSGEKSGSPQTEDSLQKAAQQISEVDDNELAQMFIEANEKAFFTDEAELVEIYAREEEHYEFEDYVPDPALLKTIGDSLKNKEFHHKKLLEENTPIGFFARIFFQIKKFFSPSIRYKEEVSLSPFDWKFYMSNSKIWRKKIGLFFDDFSSFIDLLLRNEDSTKKILKYEAFLCTISTIINIFILSYVSLIFSRESSSSGLFFIWSEAIFFSSLFSLIFIGLPPIFLTILWFVNVNYLHTSRNFHFFVFLFFTISYFLLFLAIFNIFIFFFVKNYFPVTYAVVH